jgi:hypothetical protein
MRSIILWSSVLLCLGSARPSLAQGTANAVSNPTTTIVIARTGVRLDAPHVGTYHYLEFIQSRGKWIYPDVGYIDFATNNYREVFAGGGLALLDRKQITLIGELFFDQAFGPAARGASYLMPWTMLQIRFTPKFTNETSYFLYLPLNNSARIQHVLERSKFEYALKKPWKAGVGYGGYQYGDTDWDHRPFVTTTISTGAGAFEFWLQKMPGGAQIQFRYMLVHTSGR